MPKVESGAAYMKKYSEESLSSAIKAVENGMSQRKAAATFNVPRQTLQFRLSEKFRNKTSLGPTPILTKNEEDILEDWILVSCKKGFPVRKQDIQFSVKDFLDANVRPNPFKNNLPGEGWYRAFLKRHPNLVHRTAEAVTAASSKVAEQDIRKWFSSIEDYLKKKNVQDILSDPKRIFNGDETNFVLCPKNKKVLAPRGAKNVYEVDSSQAKTNITVMFTFSADGQVTGPMIIYPYKRLPSSLVNSVPDSWGIAHSENGWMKTEIFYEYIGNVLHPCLKKAGTKFPIILFVDGHATHQTYKLSQLCTELDIILVALYPNATRLMQPADVAAFKPLKDGWRSAVIEFKRKNPQKVLNKENFAPVLKLVIDRCIKPETVKNGFRASGLFPWNPSAIDYSKCLGKKCEPVIEAITNDPFQESDAYLSYNQFKNIVGNQTIQLFSQIENASDNNEHFFTLYKIYQYFMRVNSNEQADDIVADDQDLDGNFDEMGNSHIEFCNISNGELLDIENIEIIYDDLQETQINIINDNNDNTNQSVTQVDIRSTQNENEEQVTNSMYHEAAQIKPPTNTDITEINRSDVSFDEVPTSVDDITKCQIHDNDLNSSLTDYLMWPKTPERQGGNRKQTEKLPFVLTSSTWKEMQKKKIEEKKTIEESKEKRKLERANKKNQKEKELLHKENSIKKRKTNKNRPKRILGEKMSPGIERKNSPKIESNFEKTPTNKINVMSHFTIKDDATKHIRNLFRNDNEPHNDESEKVNFTKNRYVINHLCFLCTASITTTRQGIQCSDCTRTYHVNCILQQATKISSTSEVFTCSTCAKKKYKMLNV